MQLTLPSILGIWIVHELGHSVLLHKVLLILPFTSLAFQENSPNAHMPVLKNYCRARRLRRGYT